MRMRTNVPCYLRDRDVVHRRTKINRIELIIKDKPKRYHFTVREVTHVLNSVGIRVSESTLRKYIKDGLCPAYKKSKKYRARWWIMRSHVIEMAERMNELSEYYERIKEARRTRIRYICHDRQLPDRDSRGRFRKEIKPVYDHRHMFGRLG